MAEPKPVEIHITPSNNEELTAHEVATALHKKLLLDTEMTKFKGPSKSVTIIAHKRSP